MNNNQQGLYGSSNAPGDQSLNPAQLLSRVYKGSSIEVSKQEEREQIEGIPGDPRKTNELLNQEMLSLREQHERWKKQLHNTSSGDHDAAGNVSSGDSQDSPTAQQHEQSEDQDSFQDVQSQGTTQVPAPAPQRMPYDQAIAAVSGIYEGAFAIPDETNMETRLSEIEQLIEQSEHDVDRLAALKHFVQFGRGLERLKVELKRALDFNKQIIDLFLRR